jgi:hypothetical protein
MTQNTTPNPARAHQRAAAEIEKNLRMFTGSEEVHHHWTRRLHYTDGVAYLAEAAAAHWLIDLVASYQTPKLDAKCEGAREKEPAGQMRQQSCPAGQAKRTQGTFILPHGGNLSTSNPTIFIGGS